jgi:L-aminopeptidase/D-esterase-like protein
MQGLKVGHFSAEKRGTGASVFIFDHPSEGAYHLCGASPATHELGVLDLDANVTHCDGLALLGGSAFGLSAVAGMMQWFHEHQRGLQTRHAIVPIVPAAGIYDLAVNEVSSPTAEEVYQACVSAREDDQESGRLGAGTGASVGKIAEGARWMSGGVGRAEQSLPDGATVLAYAVVNPVGDVRDARGQIIAGAKNPDGSFADCEAALLNGRDEKNILTSNTTLVALFTNVSFSRIELKRITKMATAGMARAISPVFTRYDGDIIFGFSLGKKSACELAVGALAAEVTRRAILNAVKNSVVL